MEAEAIDLISDGGRVIGLCARTPAGDLEIRAELVVGCDGRHSTMRQSAKLAVDDIAAPIDVLWFRLSRKASDTKETGGHIEAGRMLVTLNRGDYWQCAYVIPKGGIETVKREGLAAFRDRVSEIEPFLKDRVGELQSFDDIKLLTVAIDRLRQWHRPGLLCIGDAAHAMSPVGGVGVNLAVQDAVAAANIFAEPLRAGAVTTEHLAAVQARLETLRSIEHHYTNAMATAFGREGAIVAVHYNSNAAGAEATRPECVPNYWMSCSGACSVSG
jgi:2-polyprenyl-6-methoxyphenol hydroxylase-like FAD-dependent oxidoreductase